MPEAPSVAAPHERPHSPAPAVAVKLAPAVGATVSQVLLIVPVAVVPPAFVARMPMVKTVSFAHVAVVV